MDREFLEEANKKRKSFLSALKSINTSALTPIQSLECRVLKGSLETSIADFEEARHWEKDPSIPASIALYSVFLLQLRRFAPIQDRASAILSRRSLYTQRNKYRFRLGWRFEDIDRTVEKRARMRVHEIFAVKGERVFRSSNARWNPGLRNLRAPTPPEGGR
jgi:hypothetical protein